MPLPINNTVWHGFMGNLRYPEATPEEIRPYLGDMILQSFLGPFQKSPNNSPYFQGLIGNGGGGFIPLNFHD